MTSQKDPRYFLLGTVPTCEDKKINSNKLPTYKQVLLSFIATKEEIETRDAKFLRKAAKNTLTQVLEIYEKADIKMKAMCKCEDQVINLFNEFRILVNTPKVKKDIKSSQQKFSDFRQKLTKTMPFWSKNPTATEEDKAFLENMTTTRTATIGGRDMKTQATAAKKEKRKADEKNRQEKEKARKLENSRKEIFIDDEEQTISEPEDKDDKTEEMKHRRLKKTGQTLFIPPNVLSLKEVNSCAARNKISPTVMASLTSSIISGCGGDPNKFNLSYGYSYR